MKLFTSKLDVYLFLKSVIKQDIIITGSTALAAYGMSKTPDPFDLDVIIHKPNDETELAFQVIFSTYGIPKQNDYDLKDIDMCNKDIGKLISFEFPYFDAENKFKVHVFYKNKPQTTFTTEFLKHQVTLSKPSDIFLAKRIFSRKKDFKQLADICSNILIG